MNQICDRGTNSEGGTMTGGRRKIMEEEKDEKPKKRMSVIEMAAEYVWKELAAGRKPDLRGRFMVFDADVTGEEIAKTVKRILDKTKRDKDMREDVITIDYSYRPKSYWTVFSPIADTLLTVKSAYKRKILEGACRLGEYDELEKIVRNINMSRTELKRWAENHSDYYDNPNLDHEYLPKYLLGEVEIVRIENDMERPTSTTNKICIRARRVGKEIKYRVVDDNETGADIEFSPRESIQPLSLGELVALIDGAYYRDTDFLGLATAFAITNYDEDQELDDILDATTISSKFYDPLSVHYEYAIRNWYETAAKKEKE
jgi:hypothetical protein